MSETKKGMIMQSKAENEIDNLKLDSMNKSERSLLLYFECASTDYGGKFESRRMNSDDFKIADKWKEIGLIDYGRICHQDIFNHLNHWVELSDKAWNLAHQERRARNKRLTEGRRWKKTSEV